MQLSLLNQRWREGREAYRPVGETIRAAEYDAAPIPDDATAKAFVTLHHYSGSYPAARERIGLYRFGSLVGVAVFSVPMHPAVLGNVFPAVDRSELAELGRFVLVDECAGNAETWFLARAFDLLRGRGYQGIVSFSDPVARTSSTGERLHPGHIGTIYQAHNARYLGRAKAQTLRLLPDARVFSNRAASKIRNSERGWQAAAAVLVRYGADAPPAELEERRAWLDRWMGVLTRPLPHPGNHRYAWALRRGARVRLAPSQPYPKHLDRAA